MADEIERSEKYWAATEDLSKLVGNLEDRATKYYEWLQNSGNLELWRRAHAASYQGIRTQGSMRRTGENLEYTTLAVNHYGNLKQHILTMVTGQRQYFESKAANTDHKSQAQTIIATSLIETVMKEKDLETISQRAADIMLQAGEGYTLKRWDWNAGPIVAPAEEEGMPDKKSGDVCYSSHHPVDIVRDICRETHESQDWWIVRTYGNRYNYMAEYPQLADEIRKAPSITEMEPKFPRLVTSTQYTEFESDQIPLWLFIHKKTPALPNGRMMMYISKQAVLFDEPMTHREIPLYRMSAQDVVGIPLGYSTMFDLLAPQQALNAAVSTITSNLAAFGVQNIWVPEGAKLTVEQLKGGLKMISGGQQKPEGLDLFVLPQEVIKFIAMLENWLETLSGINSVTRGNPEASLKSGSALALVQAQALQFVALWQKAYIKYLENIATGTVFDFQDFGEAPHIITITGKANRQYVAEFTSASIDKISRVQVQVGNPLSGTIAGRVNMIEQLGNLGLIKTPEQYFQVLSTGRLENATEGTMAELMLIKQENETLSEGDYTQAIILENHPLHLKEHATVLSSPDARKDPNVVNSTLQHMQEHIILWMQAPPALLAVLGITPPDPSLLAAGLNNATQAQAVSQGDIANNGSLPGPVGSPSADNGMPPSQMPRMPNQPKMPRAPNGTGQQRSVPVQAAPSSPVPQ